MGWQGFQEVARGWGGNEGIRIGQGIRFQPFSAYFGPWGVGSGPFSYFGGPLLFPYYPYYIPIPPVRLCCIFLFNIGWTCSLHPVMRLPEPDV